LIHQQAVQGVAEITAEEKAFAWPPDHWTRVDPDFFIKIISIQNN
jgi:hypothetical protein